MPAPLSDVERQKMFVVTDEDIRLVPVREAGKPVPIELEEDEDA